MPFENRSEDKANAYFADGIQDEILTRLSKIADLEVISRTSTQHQSAAANLPEIAKQLGVAHILEGSVQKSGEAVRVNVQLIGVKVCVIARTACAHPSNQSQPRDEKIDLFASAVIGAARCRALEPDGAGQTAGDYPRHRH